MRKEDVVESLFSVITANGLCYSSVFSYHFKFTVFSQKIDKCD